MALVIDNFAGGGGASTGIEWALGRSPDVAINHDRQAIAMHRANHPGPRHLCEDLLDVDPREVQPGEQIDLAWFSPDCTHHSKARGGKPVSKNIRGLAWVVIRWAAIRRPRVIMLENVEEFQDWGPLTPENKPCKKRKGMTFRRWLRELHKLGYETDMAELRACDYGAPTIRKRLFVIARCDGEPIVWPAPTHGRELTPYRTAGECIDWRLPCPSIFTRKRPLAENTMRRIARGVVRFVLENPEPFIVTCNHGGAGFRGQGAGEPMKTITAAHDAHGVVTPYMARIGQTGGGGSYSNAMGEPLTTVTTKAEHLLCAPYFIPRHGEHSKQKPRTRSVEAPMPTITATANGASLVSAFLAKHYGGHETPGAACGDPISTVTAKDHHAVVASHLINMKGSDRRMRGLAEPCPTICAGGTHAGLVAALMAPYYGSGSGETGRDLEDPAPTIRTRDCLQLVTVNIDGETYILTDIGMRMLQPRELYLAQGFPAAYRIDLEVDGRRLSKADQVRMCGNSVPPQFVEALVRANLAEAAENGQRSIA